MRHEFVLLQQILVGELLAALAAFERLQAQVPIPVVEQFGLGLEGSLLANGTPERFLVGVRPQVTGQVALLQEAFAADVAGEREVSRMVGHVLVQAFLRFECLGATFELAGERSHVQVRVSVDL